MGIKMGEGINYQLPAYAAPRCYADRIQIRNVFMNKYFTEEVLGPKYQEYAGHGRSGSHSVHVSP